MLPINRRLQRTYGTIQTGPPRTPVPPAHPEWDLEPFSRLGLGDHLIVIYWKSVIGFTLNNLETNPMCRDIWDTLTYNYPTIKEMYDAYLYLCQYLEQHGFNEKVLDKLKRMTVMLRKILDQPPRPKLPRGPVGISRIRLLYPYNPPINFRP